MNGTRTLRIVCALASATALAGPASASAQGVRLSGDTALTYEEKLKLEAEVSVPPPECERECAQDPTADVVDPLEVGGVSGDKDDTPIESLPAEEEDCAASQPSGAPCTLYPWPPYEGEPMCGCSDDEVGTEPIGDGTLNPFEEDGGTEPIGDGTLNPFEDEEDSGGTEPIGDGTLNPFEEDGESGDDGPKTLYPWSDDDPEMDPEDVEETKKAMEEDGLIGGDDRSCTIKCLGSVTTTISPSLSVTTTTSLTTIRFTALR